jgi:hypothetical protein
MNNGFILCSLFHGENVYRKNFTDHLLISVFWYYLAGASHLNNKKYSDFDDVLEVLSP